MICSFKVNEVSRKIELEATRVDVRNLFKGGMIYGISTKDTSSVTVSDYIRVTIHLTVLK